MDSFPAGCSSFRLYDSINPPNTSSSAPWKTKPNIPNSNNCAPVRPGCWITLGCRYHTTESIGVISSGCHWTPQSCQTIGYWRHSWSAPNSIFQEPIIATIHSLKPTPYPTIHIPQILQPLAATSPPPSSYQNWDHPNSAKSIHLHEHHPQTDPIKSRLGN